jgi:hypothetical protein
MTENGPWDYSIFGRPLGRHKRPVNGRDDRRPVSRLRRDTSASILPTFYTFGKLSPASNTARDTPRSPIKRASPNQHSEVWRPRSTFKSSAIASNGWRRMPASGEHTDSGI